MRLCFEAKNWDALNENIVLLTKKRGQIKQVLFESWHGTSNFVVYATSEASDQPVHTRSQIRAFASRLNIL